MSASGTHVDVNDAYATRLLSRSRFECGRVESNHHSHWRRGYSALSSPVLGVRTRKALRRHEPTPSGICPAAGGGSRRVVPLLRNPPMRKESRGGRSDSNRHCGDHDPGCWPLHHGRQEKWKAGSAPRNRGQRRHRLGFGPGASCCTFRQSCLRRCDAATSSPVGPGGLSAQLHVRARALHSPCSVTSSTRPSTGRSSNLE